MDNKTRERDRAAGVAAWVIFGPIILVLLFIDWLFSEKQTEEEVGKAARNHEAWRTAAEDSLLFEELPKQF